MAIRDRLPAILALALPVLAGAAWMATSGAPSHYWLTNLGALVLAAAWIVTGRGPHTVLTRHLLLAVLLLLLLAPLVLGPDLRSIAGTGVRRWIPIGQLSLHAGMVAIPPLVMLAARDRTLAAPILLAGLFAVFLQPDSASGFAITFAAIGLHHVTRDWKVGVVAIIGFLVAIAMSLSGELPPQPFVERVLIDAARQSPVLALMLAAALGASFLLLAFAAPFERATRLALAGAFFGFVIMAMMSHYPMPLVGYGAAPILGFGLALGLHRIPAR